MGNDWTGDKAIIFLQDLYHTLILYTYSRLLVNPNYPLLTFLDFLALK